MAPGKITNEAFETKTAFGPNFKAGMDATITDGSFATILGNGAAVMPPESIDLINFVWRHLFHDRHVSCRDSCSHFECIQSKKTCDDSKNFLLLTCVTITLPTPSRSSTYEALT